jgi:O-antigen ligase
MWLFIHRPFEVWPWLGELRIERVYMLITLGAWLLVANKGWTSNRINVAVAALYGAILVSWVLSPFQVQATTTVEDFAKIGVFYVLLMSCIRDERTLRFILMAFLVCTALYMAHSLREYINGRYVYRMGTARMIGVDATLGDPNSFAASTLYALPITIPFWRTARKRWESWALAGYTGLTIICVLLTGSRTGFMGLVVVGASLLMLSRYRWRLLLAAVLLAPMAWGALPADRQTRFLTLFDPSVGPANAQQSAESREQFFWIAVDLWQQSPIVGFGPNSFRHVSETGVQAHTLYGQVLSENGILGVIALLGMLGCFGLNARDITRRYKGISWAERGFLHWVAIAVSLSVVLLLLLGLGGHNLYRFTWLWYGAFLAIAVRCAQEGYVRSADDTPTGTDSLDGHVKHFEVELVS